MARGRAVWERGRFRAASRASGPLIVEEQARRQDTGWPRHWEYLLMVVCFNPQPAVERPQRGRAMITERAGKGEEQSIRAAGKGGRDHAGPPSMSVVNPWAIFTSVP